jgi:hypothetical protein
MATRDGVMIRVSRELHARLAGILARWQAAHDIGCGHGLDQLPPLTLEGVVIRLVAHYEGHRRRRRR